jgi:hypothetical protein
MAVDRRANNGPAEIKLGLGDGGLVDGDCRFQLMHRTCGLLKDVFRNPAFALERRLPAFIGAGVIERGGVALRLRLRALERDTR